MEYPEIYSYLTGLIAGDGHIEKGNRTVISTTDAEFKNSVKSMISELKLNPVEVFDKSGGNIWRLSVNSASFKSNLLKIGLKEGNKVTVPMKFKIKTDLEFLLVSGLFDAEAWFEIDKTKYYRIRFKIKNESIIKFVMDFFLRNGICFTNGNKDKCFIININKQQEIRKFLSKVILLHPKWELIKKHFLMANGPNLLGYTRPTMVGTMRCNAERRS